MKPTKTYDMPYFWWKNLTEKQKERLAAKYFPGKQVYRISTSMARIKHIYNNQMK